MIIVNQRKMFSLAEIREETGNYRKKSGSGSGKKPVYFESMKAMLRGAFHFVSLFGKWHSQGLVYGSSDPSYFYFALSDGEMYFNGEDMLVKEGRKTDGEKMTVNEFLAPEILLSMKDKEEAGKKDESSLTGIWGAGESPRKGPEPGEELLQPERTEETYGGCGDSWGLETDWYFMSVFLFEYFYHTGSPFEGKDMVNHCFLSPYEEEVYRADQGVFCMEPGDHGNEPVRGIQDRLIKYWDVYPERLQKIFQRAFLSGGNLSDLRPTELDWKQIIVEMMVDYQVCPCGFQSFSDKLEKKETGILVCPGCGRIYYPLSDGLNRILLCEGGELYECQTGLDPLDFDTVTGTVVENRRRKGLFGIRNMSDGFWRGFYPDRTTREIHKGQVIPIWEGMTLAFERGENWTLRVTSAGPADLLAEEEVPREDLAGEEESDSSLYVDSITDDMI